MPPRKGDCAVSARMATVRSGLRGNASLTAMPPSGRADIMLEDEAVALDLDAAQIDAELKIIAEELGRRSP